MYDMESIDNDCIEELYRLIEAGADPEFSNKGGPKRLVHADHIPAESVKWSFLTAGV